MNDDFESKFWGNCTNTYGEETKQLIYAKYMGLSFFHGGKADGPYAINMTGKRVIDIGGGPVSLLLKCRGLKNAVVVDPLVWPQWVYERYEDAGIICMPMPGEEAIPRRVGTFDECWIYNVLQHVTDPSIILRNARALATTIRLFEWIETPPHPGHPHNIKADLIDSVLGKGGQRVYLNESGCVGHAYYGVWHGSPLSTSA